MLFRGICIDRYLVISMLTERLKDYPPDDSSSASPTPDPTQNGGTIGLSSRPSCLPPGVQTERSIPEELESHLIDLYFTWEQPWMQVVNRRMFEESRRSKGRYYCPLLLNCILAVGSRFSDRREVRSDPDDPNTAGMWFIEKADALLYLDLKRPTITTIQSLAIMAIFYVVSIRSKSCLILYNDHTRERVQTPPVGYSRGCLLD